MKIEEMSDNQFIYSLWLLAAIVVGGILLINGIKAAFGIGEFAWWHLGTLGVCILFAWCMRSECKEDERKSKVKRENWVKK